MGRIKTKFVKRMTNELMELHSDKLGMTFDENKKAVSSLADVGSKKLRNVMAGYATRLMKNREEL